MEAIILKYTLLNTNSKGPTKGSSGAACYDLYVSTAEAKGGGITEYGTGVSIEIPVGFVGLLFPRSSISGYGQSFCNSVGVIDSDYRGEVKVRTYRSSDVFEYYKAGERCAQLMLVPIVSVELKEFKQLSDTKRGTGGFGSSGK